MNLQSLPLPVSLSFAVLCLALLVLILLLVRAYYAESRAKESVRTAQNKMVEEVRSADMRARLRLVEIEEQLSIRLKDFESEKEAFRLQCEAKGRDLELQAQSKAALQIESIKQEARHRLEQIDEQVAKEYQSIETEKERFRAHYEAECRRIIAEVEPLRRFEQIADAEWQAKQVLADAIKVAEDLRAEANSRLEHGKAAAAIEQKEIEERISHLRLEADQILARATRDARRIVTEADKKAIDIAGDAYVALKEKESLEGAVQAIKNVIDGYGDRYVIPSHSILDELAADYGHLEAGRALQAAREQSKRMVENNEAATCDYVEDNRRITAIRFIIDAFNGRVDAILSRTRSDNYGTLTQEIQDSFNLVNLNGEAFRSARILPAYLDARLAELKWAVAGQELRLKEREEQRRIQEQIREEEKARKEIERAIRETEKEEDVLKKAMEKARLEIEAATQSERAKFEARLVELSQRLSDAEAKNQRAISMAQQTKAGHVYIISNVGSFGENVFKIGMTRRLDPLDRVRELGDASVPFIFDVHAMMYSEDAPTLEKALHEEFDEHRLNRVNYRKEFFHVPMNKLRGFVAEKKLEASFTMIAEAREYRESLAVAKMSHAEAMKFRVDNGIERTGDEN